MEAELSRDPLKSRFWCYCVWDDEDSYEYVWVRKFITIHSTDILYKLEMGTVSWTRVTNSHTPLDDRFTPITEEVFEEVNRQFLENILLKRMKMFNPTEQVRWSDNGKYLFYKPVENQ